MAKGNLFLGTARNKIGDVVLMRRNGEQVSRVRVRQIANPRTDAQTLSRLALNSATKTAQQLRGIIDHSFQGIKYGQTSVNHFTSKLTKEIRSFMEDALANPSVAPFGTAPVLPYVAGGVAAGAKALISSGDLNSISFAFRSADDGFAVGDASAFESLDECAFSDFASIFGVPATDQLTFVCGAPVALDYISETDLFYGVRFAYSRLNFKTPSGDVSLFTETEVGSGVFELNPAIVDLQRSSPVVSNLRFQNEDGVLICYALVNGNTMDTTGAFLLENVMYGACITSRYENGAWRRSTTRLIQNPKTIEQTAAAYESNYGYNDIQSCIELSVPSQKVTEDKYLNKEPNA